MPITPTLYNSNYQIFRTKAFEILSEIEGNQGSLPQSGQVHDDGIGVPTIGFGYALVFRDSNGVYLSNTNALADLTNQTVGATVNTTLFSNTLTQIVTALNSGQSTNALISQLNGAVSSLTSNQAVQLFNVSYDRSYSHANNGIENTFRQHISATDASNLFNTLIGSQELLAISSLHFNGPGAVGPNLTNALLNGDRALAWYEIRY